MRGPSVPSGHRPDVRPGRWQLTTDCPVSTSLSLFAAPSAPRTVSLPAKTELRDERSVPLDVVAPEVVEQSTPPSDQHEQASTRVMVLLVDLQMLGEVVDPLGEQSDLHLRRTGVGLMEAVLGDRGGGVGHAKASEFRCEDASAPADAPLRLPRPVISPRCDVLPRCRHPSAPRAPRSTRSAPARGSTRGSEP